MSAKVFSLVALFLAVLFFLSCFVEAKNVGIQPEPVTDPTLLKRLNCQMTCRNELHDNSPDCVYRCISDKCTNRIFKSIINDKNKIDGEITDELRKKFEDCAEKESGRIKKAKKDL
eukprot:TRINITY_DN1975_c0_g1_i1.p2 TRINITY_DN1975_c0_g1~~TRINITY_DN1975_c0_g1_i1.p2  ORF type:complete len:131 (-),score=49.19 TRINITY_DN1975_c0_g1_i1:42-389(-)